MGREILNRRYWVLVNKEYISLILDKGTIQWLILSIIRLQLDLAAFAQQSKVISVLEVSMVLYVCINKQVKMQKLSYQVLERKLKLLMYHKMSLGS